MIRKFQFGLQFLSIEFLVHPTLRYRKSAQLLGDDGSSDPLKVLWTKEYENTISSEMVLYLKQLRQYRHG